MKKRVLITGASGFVGFHLIQAAIASDFEVFAAVRASSKIDHLKSLPITFTFSNLSSVEELEKEFNENRYQYIIHAAGTTKARKKEDYERVNADYTRNLALAVQRTGLALDKFILVSSLAAMGPLPTENGEEGSPHPMTWYGKSKLKAEGYLSEFNIPSIIVRPTAVYGPRERDIFLMVKAINQGFELYVGNKAQQLSFIHVTDLANVIIRLLESPYVQKTYTLTDGDSYDRYALGAITREVLGKRTVKIHLPLGLVKVVAGIGEMVYGWNGKIPVLNKEKLKELTAANWHYSTDAIRTDIGFTPMYNLEKGLRQTLKWYQQHNWI